MTAPVEPPETPSPAPRRRWWWVLPPVALAVAALFAVRADLLDLLGEAGHVLAGVGDLEWWDGDGWVAVTPADARRRQWGPTDEFLTADYHPIAPGLDIADLAVRRSPNPQVVDVVVARVEPARWRFRVRVDEEPRTVPWFAGRYDL